jgi:S1-C subfamily serine protease
VKNIVASAWIIVLALLSGLLLNDARATQADNEEKAALISGPLEEIRTGQQNLKRVTAVLNELGKNLIMEKTRGQTGIAVYAKTAPTVVLIQTKDGFGSGVIIDAQGHVITNWHVVGNYKEAIVYFKPKNDADLKNALAFRAQVERVDQVADLALLKIERPPQTFPSLGFGNASALNVGQDVHAIGHPNGALWTYTTGTISQIRSDFQWTAGDGISHQAKVVQTQTPINPGNSGGPLLDDGGMLIGINSFRSQGEGLNYAISVDQIKSFLKSQGNRIATAPAKTGEPNCPEAYSSGSQAKNDIFGCYGGQKVPPPDFWLVYTNRKNLSVYSAIDSQRSGKIDTLVVNYGENGELLWLMDQNCDGSVDLIGHQYPGVDDIDSYQVPSTPTRIDKIAQELNTALKLKKIPYRLRVCP